MSSHCRSAHRWTQPRRPRAGAIAIAVLLALTLTLGLNQVVSSARASGSVHAAKKRKNHDGQYLRLAKKGISDSYKNFWNPQHSWFNDRLNDNDQFPLGTIWTIFPLWEAVSGVAKAEPKGHHQSEVAFFANTAEGYYNAPNGGYGPYPGSHDAGNEIWFDDNAWWGLAFVDAYRVTHDGRYLDDAGRAMDFMEGRGWDNHRHTFAWSTHVGNAGSNLETMGGGAALAAELYQYTHKARFRKMAHKYIHWGMAKAKWTYKKKHKKRHHHWRGIFEAKDQGPLTYTEGTFLGADLALCRSGQTSACRSAWDLARVSYKHWRGRDPFYKPPADTIMFRYVLQTAGEKKVQKVFEQRHYKVSPRMLWKWARKSAEDALNNSRQHGLFVKFWDGSDAASHHDGYRSYRYGQLMTHAAPVALLAWLAAVKEPAPVR